MNDLDETNTETWGLKMIKQLNELPPNIIQLIVNLALKCVCNPKRHYNVNEIYGIMNVKNKDEGVEIRVGLNKASKIEKEDLPTNEKTVYVVPPKKLIKPVEKPIICRVPDCDSKKHYSMGLCSSHYSHMYRLYKKQLEKNNYWTIKEKMDYIDELYLPKKFYMELNQRKK